MTYRTLEDYVGNTPLVRLQRLPGESTNTILVKGVKGQLSRMREACQRLAEAGSRVSLFIDPDAAQIEAAAEVGAPVFEIHTACARLRVRTRDLRGRDGHRACSAHGG